MDIAAVLDSMFQILVYRMLTNAAELDYLAPSCGYVDINGSNQDFNRDKQIYFFQA